MEIENPFSQRKAGFVIIHSSHLIIRGQKGSQKDGFTMKRFCVLVFDNEKCAGYILCFKTKSAWKLFEKAFFNQFFDDNAIDWSAIQKDDKLDEIIALKDAHVDNSELPPHKKETFIKKSNEIFIYRGKTTLNHKSLTSRKLNEHYLILNDDDYIEWIGHIQKMAIVEKKAIQFRETQKLKLLQQQQQDKTVSSSSSSSSPQTEQDTKPIMGTADNEKGYFKQMFIGLLSIVISAIGVGYWQYNEYLEMLAEQQRQEEELLRQQQLQEYLKQEALSKAQVLQEALSTLSSDIDSDTNSFLIGSTIALVMFLLCIGGCLKSICFCFCRKKAEEGRWQRDGPDGRLSSRY